MTVVTEQKRLQALHNTPYPDVLKTARYIYSRAIEGPEDQVFNLSPVFRVSRSTGYAVPDQQVGRAYFLDTLSDRVVNGIAEMIQRIPFNDGLRIYQLWTQRRGENLFIEVVKVVDRVEDAFTLARESNTGIVYSFGMRVQIAVSKANEVLYASPPTPDPTPFDDVEFADNPEPEHEEPDDEDVLVPVSVVRKEVEAYQATAKDLSEDPDLPYSRDHFKSMIGAYNLVLKILDQIERDYNTKGYD